MSSTSSTAMTVPTSLLDATRTVAIRSHNPVLVALDGTPVAEQAIPFAATLAERWSAPLKLVHVRNPVDEAYGFDVRVLDDLESVSLQSRGGAYLKRMTEALLDTNDIAVASELRIGKSVADTLRSACESNASILVMVRTRRSAIHRFLWSSVSNDLIGRLTVPLLLVPQADSNGGAYPADSPEFDRILVYHDGADAVTDVLESVKAVASPRAICQLLRVLPMSSHFSSGKQRVTGTTEPREQAWLELLRARKDLERSGVPCSPQLIFSQHAGEVVVEQAEAMRAQLIVIPSRPYLLPWWVRKGVTEYLVRNATVPLLIVSTTGNTNFRKETEYATIHSN